MSIEKCSLDGSCNTSIQGAEQRRKPMSLIDYNTCCSKNSTKTVFIQKGFWQDNFIGTTRAKLEELYRNRPKAFEADKETMLAFWSQFENLEFIIGDKFQEFSDWFISRRATSPETISRCCRAMREDGTISSNPEESGQGKEQADNWRKYWSHAANFVEANDE